MRPLPRLRPLGPFTCLRRRPSALLPPEILPEQNLEDLGQSRVGPVGKPRRPEAAHRMVNHGIPVTGEALNGCHRVSALLARSGADGGSRYAPLLEKDGVGHTGRAT